MSRSVLLLGRKPFDESEVRQSLSDLDVTVRTGTTMDDVGAAFDAGSVDVVIMGAGLGLDIRLAIVRAVFEASTSTSVHMKDRDSGQAGMLTFVRGVLRGLA
jgi:ribosomal protein S12 methylthiotransferase accessory factor YcaO